MKATEKHKEQMKQWNKSHTENLRISQKKYYETHKDYFKQFNRTTFKDMQQRIEKAIEYIKDMGCFDNECNYFYDDLSPYELDILLNILRGENK